MVLLLTSLLTIGVSLATPLLLAALGELIVEQAGMINVGIEGMALAGALAGFVASCACHSPWVGLLAAALAGIVLAALSGYLNVRLGTDQVVVGTAINILSLGLTGVFFRAFSSRSQLTSMMFHAWDVPFLSQIPLIGRALFAQNVLGYLAWLCVPCSAFYLRRTLSGLRLRALGEYPDAADAAGVSVTRFRVLALLWGGAMAGMAGAYLSIGYTNGFTENMTAGRGFIALAVVILGRWSAGGVAIAALLFGLADALHYVLLSVASPRSFLGHVPYQFLQALPYLLTILALALRTRFKTASPAALGQVYTRR